MPPAAGFSRANRAKTSARDTAPAAEINQPPNASPPNGASDAGSKNTPEPIMFPITRATAVQNPIERLVANKRYLMTGLPLVSYISTVPKALNASATFGSPTATICSRAGSRYFFATASACACVTALIRSGYLSQ